MLEVALAGNPNTGKTTLFNALTGARAHVGNYPGITVERRHGVHATADGHWRVHDLPGCYSLSALSPEEEIAHHALSGRFGDRFDVAIVVLDAANLARNLLLLLQIADLDLPVVAALNMMDAADAAGLQVDVTRLQAALGCPVVPLVARRSEGLPGLEAAVLAVTKSPGLGRLRLAVDWPADVRRALDLAQPILLQAGVVGAVPAANTEPALWWLTADPAVADRASPGLGARLLTAVPRAPVAAEDVRRRATVARFAAIDGVLDACLTRTPLPPGPSERIDRWVLHPVAGALLFLAAMAALFQAVFAWADPAVQAVEWVMGSVAAGLEALLPDGLLRDVLVDGVLAGVAGTFVFLPQILLLFLGIGLMEDSGYLARTAFLVDRLMARVGLPGKAFVPLLSSFACAVPGIMATRTMTDPRDRLLTILVAPLMSCSARLPVYTLVTAAVFAGTLPVLGVLSVGGLVVTAMYTLGFAVALASAFVLRRTLVPGGGGPLLLEMPPYRWPRPRNVLRMLWDRGRVFVLQTGTVIVGLSVVLWALMTFPQVDLDPIERNRLVAAANATTAAGSAERATALADVEHRDTQHRLANSLAGHIGHAVEPFIAPLGFDWRIGIGLVGSLAAREVLVPVLGQVYGRGSQQDGDERFSSELGRSMARDGSLTPLKGVSLMVFFAIAMQCLSTVATIRRETNSWRWPLFTLGYLNGLAWLASFAVYQAGLALGYS